MAKIEWTAEDSKETKDFLIQIIHVGSITKKQADRLEELVLKALTILEAAKEAE